MTTIAHRRAAIRRHNRLQPLCWIGAAVVLAALGYVMISTTMRLGGRYAAVLSSLAP